MDRSAATTQQLYRVPDAMQLLSLSRSVIYEQIRTGRLKSVTQGRTRLIPASAIDGLRQHAAARGRGDDAA